MVAAEDDKRMGRESATGLERNWRGELGAMMGREKKRELGVRR